MAGRHRYVSHGRDRNHAEVMDVFRSLCPVVEDHSQGDHGYDLLILNARGVAWVVEIKDGSLPPSRRALTPNEKAARIRWGRRFRVVTSIDEAIALTREVA